jgi:hypothetical protein
MSSIVPAHLQHLGAQPNLAHLFLFLNDGGTHPNSIQRPKVPNIHVIALAPGPKASPRISQYAGRGCTQLGAQLLMSGTNSSSRCVDPPRLDMLMVRRS